MRYSSMPRATTALRLWSHYPFIPRPQRASQYQTVKPVQHTENAILCTVLRQSRAVLHAASCY